MPSRVEVLEKMVVALDRWDINTKRNINYRSFEPILRLVKVIHTPQCQHWASWALANLTRTDGKHEASLVNIKVSFANTDFLQKSLSFDTRSLKIHLIKNIP